MVYRKKDAAYWDKYEFTVAKGSTSRECLENVESLVIDGWESLNESNILSVNGEIQFSQAMCRRKQ